MFEMKINKTKKTFYPRCKNEDRFCFYRVDLATVLVP